MTVTLVGFLKGRIDEDERYLKSNAHHLWTQRPLLEVAAKRARLARYEHNQARFDDVLARPGEYSAGDEGMWFGMMTAALLACHDDAAVYSDHPDYNPEWEPRPVPPPLDRTP